jgi:hypothetical protein
VHRYDAVPNGDHSSVREHKILVRNIILDAEYARHVRAVFNDAVPPLQEAVKAKHTIPDPPGVAIRVRNTKIRGLRIPTEPEHRNAPQAYAFTLNSVSDLCRGTSFGSYILRSSP